MNEVASAKSRRRILTLSPRSSRRSERRNSNEIILEPIQAQPATTNISQSSSSSSLNDASRNISSEQQVSKAAAYSAPQLKIAEDGSLILNEESLIIHRTEVEPVFDSTVIENEQNDNLSYNSYRKFHHTKKWSQRGKNQAGRQACAVLLPRQLTILTSLTRQRRPSSTRRSA